MESFFTSFNFVQADFRTLNAISPLKLKLLYGGVLGIALSILTAEYLSAAFYRSYSESIFFRNFTGLAPNQISDFLHISTWGLTFFACWWMLWKLDVLISKESMVEPVEPLKDETFTEKSEHDKNNSFSDEPEETNRQTNNDSNKTGDQQVEDETQENTSEEQVKPSKEELGFASILEVEEFDDPEKIKIVTVRLSLNITPIA